MSDTAKEKSESTANSKEEHVDDQTDNDDGDVSLMPGAVSDELPTLQQELTRVPSEQTDADVGGASIKPGVVSDEQPPPSSTSPSPPSADELPQLQPKITRLPSEQTDDGDASIKPSIVSDEQPPAPSPPPLDDPNDNELSPSQLETTRLPSEQTDDDDDGDASRLSGAASDGQQSTSSSPSPSSPSPSSPSPSSLDELSDDELPQSQPEIRRLPSEQNKPDAEDEKPFESRMLKLLSMGFPFEWCEEALSLHPPPTPIEEVVDLLLARSFHEAVPDGGLDYPLQSIHSSDLTPMQPPQHFRADSTSDTEVSFTSSTQSSNSWASDEDGAIERQQKLREQQQKVIQRLAAMQQSSINDEKEQTSTDREDSKRRDAHDAEGGGDGDGGDAEFKHGNDHEKMLMCMICFDNIPVSDLVMGKCGHGQCKDCLFGYYRSLITDGKVKFTCVESECRRAIKDAEVMLVIDEDADLVQKYKRFKRNHAIAANPNGRWCSSPGCDTPIIGKKGTRRLVCPTCEAETCFHCALPFHRGNCNSEIDKQYHKWAKDKNVRKCPKCSARVQKTGGCNHMVCPSCNQQWCWLCGSRYRGSNHYSEWNPLGCRGRQFDERNDRVSLCSHVFRKAFWVVCCPIALTCFVMEMYDCDCCCECLENCFDEINDCCCN